MLGFPHAFDDTAYALFVADPVVLKTSGSVGQLGGSHFASRMGASLCAATGLNELICSTPEAYQHKAIELGQQPNELQRMRHHLLDHHHNLPLFNTAAWVKNFENLLEQLFA